MKKLQFRCILKSDVILNAQARTEGNQETLDFIPGNNFLGILAAKYQEFTKEQQTALFHSGKVRFGDAHPEMAPKVGIRTLRAPLAWYYPKGKSMSDACYLHHFYDRKKEGDVPQQLKQCRKGFYVFDGNEAYLADTPSSFAIKSAYDRVNRRSLGENMYGYSSLDEGTSFLFEVEVDNDSLCDVIVNALVGKKRIGRSRTAQYGLVEIEKATFAELATQKTDGTVYVYADSRLIFLDDNGEPHLHPSAKDLGLNNGKVSIEKSQVRSFQYAPWNYKRQCRDTDRYGVEKGSVFVVTDYTGDLLTSNYVGAYQNEGFGKVIYNPYFLIESQGNGEAVVKPVAKNNDDGQTDNKSTVKIEGTALLNYIANAMKKHEADLYIYEKVNEYTFNSRNKAFASQWGKIRCIAMTCKTAEELRHELFNKEKRFFHHASPDDPKEEWRKKPAGYLAHGIAAKKWKEGKGKEIEKLKIFINTMESSNYGDIACLAVVNLASVIAKKIKKDR